MWIFFLVAVLALMERPVCRDGDGNPVDWWFMYKAASKTGTDDDAGLRFVYTDSSKAQRTSAGKRYTVDALDYKKLINDPQKSPLLRTIMDPFTKKPVSKQRDTTVWIAVNDESSSGKDAFGKPITCDSGHVKFFTSAQVLMPEDEDDNKVVVFSYLIQHSLPRFPRLPVDEDADGIFTNSLPDDPQDLFDSNLRAKGQHFFCMSFRDEQTLDKKPEVAKDIPKKLSRQLEYRPEKMEKYLKSGKHHFACILHYLKVTHAAVIGTNYDPISRGHSVYHQYLNVFNRWSMVKERRTINNNMSRWELPNDKENYDSDHLCPMWPLPRRVRINRNGKAYGFSSDSDLASNFSMRSSSEAAKGVCRSWSHGNDDLLCLASAHLKTTDSQFPLRALLLMKNQNVKLSPYDELLAPLVVPLGDFQGGANKVGEAQMDVGLIVQTWIDFATIPDLERKLVDEQGKLEVNLKIYNSSGITLPVVKSNGGLSSVFMSSQNVDHAKWAVAVPRNPGTMANLVAFSDLNRTLKHGHGSGRGGGILCLSSHVLSEILLSFNPRLGSTTQDYASPDSLASLYQGWEDQQKLVTAVRFYSDKVILAGQRYQSGLTLLGFTNPFAEVDEDLDKQNAAIPRFPDRESNALENVEIHGEYELERPDRNSKINHAIKELPDYQTGPLLTGNRTRLLRVADNIATLTFRFWSLLQQSYSAAAGFSAEATHEWLKGQLNRKLKKSKK